jgi:xylose isomerase
MKGSLLAIPLACAELTGCAKAHEEPEVAYRHCLWNLADRFDHPTYKQVAALNRECDGLALEAARIRARKELGVRFDPKNRETINTIRDKHELIVSAHVCAASSDRPTPRCGPYM